MWEEKAVIVFVCLIGEWAEDLSSVDWLKNFLEERASDIFMDENDAKLVKELFKLVIEFNRELFSIKMVELSRSMASIAEKDEISESNLDLPMIGMNELNIFLANSIV